MLGQGLQQPTSLQFEQWVVVLQRDDVAQPERVELATVRFAELLSSSQTGCQQHEAHQRAAQQRPERPALPPRVPWVGNLLEAQQRLALLQIGLHALDSSS